MKSRRPLAILAGALMAFAPAAGAVASVRVAYGYRVVTTQGPVLGLPVGTLVPLRPVVQALGGRVQWDEAARIAVVQHGSRRLEVDENTHAVRLDGKALPQMAARTVQRQLLVPLAAVERLFGVRGRWLPQQRLLRFAAAGGGGPMERRRGEGEGARAPNSGHPSESVQLRLTSDRPTYKVGDPIVLTLTVTNPGRAPVTLQFASGQHYDIEVRHEGQTVWRWAADRMFIQALTSLTLKPGEQRAFTETWKQLDNQGQPVAAGTYEAVATLTTMSRPQPHSAPLTLRIGA